MEAYTFFRKACVAQMLCLQTSAISAAEPVDSVDNYHNHQVAAKVKVQGRNLLNTGNVMVAETGDLTLGAPDGVLITGAFEVIQGGVLLLNGGSQYSMSFDYDMLGNKICNRKDWGDD